MICILSKRHQRIFTSIIIYLFIYLQFQHHSINILVLGVDNTGI